MQLERGNWAQLQRWHFLPSSERPGRKQTWSGRWADVRRFPVFSKGPAGSSVGAAGAAVTLPLAIRDMGSRAAGSKP